MKSQRGGFILGMIVGLLIGLALALAVALYVTKVPVPFINKVPQRTAEQDAAEAERNRNWDPNGPLSTRPLPRQASAPAPAPAIATPTPAPVPPAPAPAVAARPGAASVPLARGAASAPSVSAKVGADPFTYFVQAGAYARGEEAEQQRAKLAMLGYAAKVTEREQSGRTMYRVRLGPFEKKDDAEGAQTRLAGNGIEAALVRVQK